MYTLHALPPSSLWNDKLLKTLLLYISDFDTLLQILSLLHKPNIEKCKSIAYYTLVILFPAFQFADL